MCVIVHTPDKKHRPSLDTLRACERANPHGNGIAWQYSGRVHYLKGLSAPSIAEVLDTLEGPVVIHFRYATVGAKSTELCHPFPVTQSARPQPYGTARSVLFHNGHWAEWEEFEFIHNLELHGPVSDSRVIAVGTFLGGFEWLRTVPSGRFALMSADTIELLGEWLTHACAPGCKFSNLNWERFLPAPPAANSGKLESFYRAPKKPKGRGRTASDCGDAMGCFGD